MLQLSSLYIILACLFSLVSAHNHLLPAYGKACFYEDVKKGDQLAVTFQVGNRDPYASEQPIADFWVCTHYQHLLEFSN